MSKKTTTTSQADPWAPSTAARTSDINSASAIQQANQGGIQKNANTLSAGFDALAPTAFNNPLQHATEGQLTDTLGGKYLNSNPYLDSIIGTNDKNVTNTVNGQFETGGRYGSANHAGILATRLSDSDNALRYANYNDERSRQLQAAGLDGATQQAKYAGVNPLLALAGGAATLPYTGLDAAGNVINAASSGYGTGKNTAVTSGLGQVVDTFSNYLAAAGKAAAAGG